MEMTIVGAIILSIVILIIGAIYTNKVSYQKHEYKPINIANIFIMLLPFGFIILGFIVFQEDKLNQILAVVFSIIIILIIFFNIYRKSNFIIAIISIFILLFIGLLVAILIMGMGSSENDDDDYD